MGPPKKRDEDWFTGLYVAEYANIVRYGLRRLADPDASAELAQEVFVVAWRRRHEVPDRSLPWLYGVARRLLANHWRSRRAAPDVLLSPVPTWNGSPSRRVPTPPSGSPISGPRWRSSELDQEILRLIGWEELTVSEAAQALGCTRATAAVRLHRARRRFAEAMSDRPVQSQRRPVLAITREEL
ncbi:RNA polymerase sigma factor [Micromonospora sp. R77]|uniref:RNA polymerase sigma factor n=1 Tax=Micromonospora sp. R77 TaxID=2925836 RepID=UPI001F60FC4D|nr:RNA polymerase sigma factor [Micromonospora sp. R77]MCI4066297.1 RNA polymerase sigma factor [Micromonospora sp. R77]